MWRGGPSVEKSAAGEYARTVSPASAGKAGIRAVREHLSPEMMFHCRFLLLHRRVRLSATLFGVKFFYRPPYFSRLFPRKHHVFPTPGTCPTILSGEHSMGKLSMAFGGRSSPAREYYILRKERASGIRCRNILFRLSPCRTCSVGRFGRTTESGRPEMSSTRRAAVAGDKPVAYDESAGCAVCPTG